MRKGVAKTPVPNGTTVLNGFEYWTGDRSFGSPAWHLYSGDARAVLQTLQSDHVSCVVTSPPYFWQRDYDVAGQIGLEPSVEAYVKSVCDVMHEVKRVLHPEG